MLFLALFAVAAVAITPHHPQWPADFSTTAVINFGGVSRPDFNRWFYSKELNVDRIDGLAEWEGELYFAERYFNHGIGREYAVFYQRDSSVTCFDRPITNPLPKPDFTNFTYVGEAIIDYVPVYHWIYRTPNNRDFFQFFDVIGSRLPARFDAEFGERPAVQINYMEFDNGSQDKTLFQIPSEIMSVCNKI